MKSSSPSTSYRRPAIHHCPVCGIAMQASKSREDLAEFDTFQCLNCESKLGGSPPPGANNGR